MSDVAVAVLAAGRGSRFGGDKLLADLRGRPLVAHAFAAALGSGLRPAVAVVGHRSGDVAALVPAGMGAVKARGWRHGISRSLRAALDALGPYPQVGAVVVGLGDQPLVSAAAYRRVGAAYAAGASLAVATYRGVRANPVLLAREHWAEARRLDGDVGARALMLHHPVVEVSCDGAGDPRDVDTTEDLAALEQAAPGDAEPDRA